MTKYSLTKKQEEVYQFIQRYLLEHRSSPLIREIQAGCSITSYKSAIDRLNAIERKGFIKRIPNKHRGIKLARKAPMEARPAEASLQGAQPEGPGEAVPA